MQSHDDNLKKSKIYKAKLASLGFAYIYNYRMLIIFVLLINRSWQSIKICASRFYLLWEYGGWMAGPIYELAQRE